MKVTVTSPRTTVYQKAHRTAEVLLTPRVQELINSGDLQLVGEGSTYVEKTADGDVVPAQIINAPTRNELVIEAQELGIDVKTSWSKTRISEAIEEYAAPAAESEVYIVPEEEPYIEESYPEPEPEELTDEELDKYVTEFDEDSKS